jgi:hypothetical protein
MKNGSVIPQFQKYSVICLENYEGHQAEIWNLAYRITKQNFPMLKCEVRVLHFVAGCPLLQK